MKQSANNAMFVHMLKILNLAHAPTCQDQQGGQYQSFVCICENGGQKLPFLSRKMGKVSGAHFKVFTIMPSPTVGL